MFIVILTPNDKYEYAYGPFDNRALAERFAAYLADEVDPARVVRLSSPTRSLLDWRAHQAKGGSE
jgi:hypothetical protein